MKSRVALIALSSVIAMRTAAVPAAGRVGETESLTLVFDITQNVELYQRSAWGHPPQAAIWLKDPSTGKTRTVWVTSRTATGNFSGKVECPNSLPYWIGVFRKEFGRDGYPTPKNPLSEAVTGATPVNGRFRVTTEVFAGTTWNYYIEVNVSGDFNTAFSKVTPDGRPDQYGCGQPSIVYEGTITAAKGARSSPKIIGRTHRMIRSTELIADLDGITTARNLYEKIEVVCE